MLYLITYLFIGGAQPQPLRLRDQKFPADQILRGALGEVRNQHRGLLATTRKLLTKHLPGLALHLRSSDGLTRNSCQDPLPRTAQANAGAYSAWHQGDHHGGADDEQQAAENDLFSRARGLQKSNHFHSKFSGGTSNYKPRVREDGCTHEGSSLRLRSRQTPGSFANAAQQLRKHDREVEAITVSGDEWSRLQYGSLADSLRR